MESHPGISPYGAALAGKCPRCGKGALYAGLLKLAPQCGTCGLAFARYDQGDGPAAFAILIIGFIVTGGVLWLELVWHAPYWLQAVIWLPVVIILTVICVRMLKSWLLAAQFRHDAQEGRLSGDHGADE